MVYLQYKTYYTDSQWYSFKESCCKFCGLYGNSSFKASVDHHFVTGRFVDSEPMYTLIGFIREYGLGTEVTFILKKYIVCGTYGILNDY